MEKKVKKYIPIECPVCHKQYFSRKGKISEYDQDEDYECSFCGWKYDLSQAENPELKDGKNDMSVNEYISWYKSKIQENANWKYYMDFAGEPKQHLCPVCGEYTFSEELSYEICHVCGWEDTGFEDFPDEKPSKSDLTFNERVKWFQEQRVKNPQFKWIRAKEKK